MSGADRVRGRIRGAQSGGAGGPRRDGGPRTGLASPVRAVGPGERLAAVSGAALVLLMLLDWFGGRNAWQLELTDLVLVAIAAFAVAVAVARGAGREPFGPAATGPALTVAGGVAVGAMLTLVLESSGGTVPLVLSLVAAGGILGGGLLAIRAAGGAAGPPAEVRPSAVQPRTAPARRSTDRTPPAS